MPGARILLVEDDEDARQLLDSAQPQTGEADHLARHRAERQQVAPARRPLA